MSRHFNLYLQSLGDTEPYCFDRHRFLADGFGPDPAFGGFITEVAAQAAGYLLHCPSYNVDLGMRELMVIDLWTEPAFRGLGIGRQLMAAAADLARRRRAKRLIWAVFKPNLPAYEFYHRLGAATIEGLDWMEMPVG
ncbi:MAG: GNAT family N-acetyltransferase [Dongiaceae bacterium]